MIPDLLNGKKTYICGIAAVVVVGAEALGWITPETKTTLLELLGASGIMALRAGVAKG